MISSKFLYSLKVWLTSVVVAPILFSGIRISIPGLYRETGVELLSKFFESCFGLIFIELFFSFVIWLIFLVAVQIIVTCVSNEILRRWTLFITGLVLTMAPFIILMPWGEILDITDFFTGIMLCNCFCISWGVWYYKLIEPESGKAV